MELFVVILVLLALWWIYSRIHQVPEGHKAVIERFGRFGRVAGPGLYFRWPWEKEVSQMLIRQQETELSVPTVFTHAGMPVSVNLAYSMALDPKKMNVGEIYYSEEERQKQQVHIFKSIFQPCIDAAPRPPANADKSNPAILFSPFVGKVGTDLREQIEAEARSEFEKHGYILSSRLNIQQLTLVPQIGKAIVEHFSNELTQVDKAALIRRLREAAPDLSESTIGLIMTTMQNPNGELKAIFSSGTVRPNLLGSDDMVFDPEPAQNANQTTVAATPSAAAAQSVSVGRLKASDMQLLKDLPD
ncbi:MAG: SPFH domain-containing protein [Caldilineaceae bacterium]